MSSPPKCLFLAWITAGYGRNCSYLGDPYINNCGFDASGSMLGHFYGNNSLRPAGTANVSNLFRFDQTEYVADRTPALISLGDTGYIYIPLACQNGTYECKLHTVSALKLYRPTMAGSR
jgi:hypothetical protein